MGIVPQESIINSQFPQFKNLFPTPNTPYPTPGAPIPPQLDTEDGVSWARLDEGCVSWLEAVKAQRHKGAIATHTLAEVYAVLTRLPLNPRISGTLAQRLIAENLAQFEVIPLTTEDYQAAIAKMVRLNLTGGGIYDALIAQVALKSEADVLLTLNPSHFTRLGTEVANLVQVPQ